MEEQQQTTSPAPQGCFFCTVAAPQIEAFLDHLWPEQTRQHFQNARIEVLKGMRSMIDARIAHLSQHAAKGTKLTVE